MDAIDERKLRENYVELVRNLNPEDVMDYLYQERVFSEEDCETVRSGPTRAQRVRLFLDVLPKKSSNGLSKLLEAMESAGYIELATAIESTSIALNEHPSAVNSCNTSTLLSDLEFHKLIERLEQQTQIVTSIRIEMKQTLDTMKQLSQKGEGSEEQKQAITFTGELEKEENEQKEIIEEVYESMLNNFNRDKKSQSTISLTILTLNPKQSLDSYKQQSYVKVLLIGDGAVGKSSIIHYFIAKEMLKSYIPTVFNQRTKDVVIGDTMVALDFWDTAGQEDYDRLRPLCYAHTNIALLVFSVASQCSLQNIMAKWQPEFKNTCSGVPYILVGNKTDVGEDHQELADLRRSGKRLVKAQEADEAARLMSAAGGKAFLCSAFNGDGIAHLLDSTVKTALEYMRRSQQQNQCCEFQKQSTYNCCKCM